MNKLAAVLMLGFAISPVASLAQRVPDTGLTRQAKEAHDNAVRAVGQFYDCIAGYVGQHADPRATALVIADAAVAACSVHVGSYVTYLTTSRTLSLTAHEPGLNGDLLNQRKREAEAESQVDGESLRADGRGVGVKCVFELQALAEKALKKKEEQAFPTAQPRSKLSI